MTTTAYSNIITKTPTLTMANYVKDSFPSNESAPMVSPRTCEVGSAVIVDTGNRLSIVDGELNSTSGGTGYGDPTIFYSAIPYTRGIAVISEIFAS